MTVRSRLAVVGLVLSVLAAAAGLGTAPAGAGVAPVCETDDAATIYVCAGYDAFPRRFPTTAEVEYWAPRMPASKTVFTTTLARSAEGRYDTVYAYYQHFTPWSPSEDDLDYWMPLVTQPKGLRKLEAALMASRGGTVPEYVVDLYDYYLDREPGAGELAYWSGQVALKGRNLTASDVVQSPEARELRVIWTYRNEIVVEPDAASVDYWSERLRTGTIWLDLRIALRSSEDGYPSANGNCSSSVPLVEPRCRG